MFLTPSPIADLILVMICCLILAHSVMLAFKKRWLLFDPLNLFWAGVLVVYIIQPISNAELFISWHKEGIFEATLLWIFVGMIFVVIGYEYGIGPIRARLIPLCPVKLHPAHLTLSGYFLIGIGIVGYLYLFASAGGVSNWLAVGRGGTNYAQISGYTALLADFLPLGILLLVFQNSFNHATKIRTILVLSAGILMWLWFVYLGTRGRTIIYAVMLLAAYYLPRKTRPPLWSLIVGWLLMFLLVNFQANYRSNFTNLSFNLDKIDVNQALISSASGFLNNDNYVHRSTVSRGIDFNCVMSVVELVPDEVPYNYGYGHLEIITRIIPRAIWPEKFYPAMESVQGVLKTARLARAHIRGTNLLMGPAFTFAGHWYYVAGPIGIILGGLLTGSILRIIRHVYDRHENSEGDMILFTTLTKIGFVEAAATPLNWVFNLPLIIVPLLLLFIFCKVKA